MLIEFSVAPWRGEHMWGGGHTCVSDPMQLWNATSPSPGVILVARRSGAVGCFTARLMGSGNVDVAFFSEETPKEILEVIKNGKSGDLNPYYVEFRNIPGWGLYARDKLADLMYIDELDRQGLY